MLQPGWWKYRGVQDWCSRQGRGSPWGKALESTVLVLRRPGWSNLIEGCPTWQRQGQGMTITMRTTTRGTMTVKIIIGITIWLTITVDSIVVKQWPPVMEHAYVLRKPWQTDMDGPIRYSSLMLEHEEHLKTNDKQNSWWRRVTLLWHSWHSCIQCTKLGYLAISAQCFT
jgi:hypothetical protein